jgi:hypothetical protein
MFHGPPLPSPPRAFSLIGCRSPQDPATDTGTGSIARMKKHSIESLFSDQSPRPELLRFVHASAQPFELRNIGS